jgi:hypothetical protein
VTGRDQVVAVDVAGQSCRERADLVPDEREVLGHQVVGGVLRNGHRMGPSGRRSSENPNVTDVMPRRDSEPSRSSVMTLLFEHPFEYR